MGVGVAWWHPEEVSLDKSKHNTPRLYIYLSRTLMTRKYGVGVAWRQPEETPRQIETKIFLGRRGRGGTLKKYPRQVEAKDGLQPCHYYFRTSFSRFLKRKKKLVRGFNPHLSFNRPLHTRQTDLIILDITNALTFIRLTRRV